MFGGAMLIGDDGDDELRRRRWKGVLTNADGGPGRDRITVNGTAHGGTGPDVIVARWAYGDDGADTLYTGARTAVPHDVSREAWGGTGDDELYGFRGRGVLHGGPGDDLLKNAEEAYGNAGADTLFRGCGWCSAPGTGLLDGGNDDDVLQGADAGTIRGRSGNDVIRGGVRALGGPGDDDVRGGPHGSIVRGGGGDDVVRGFRGEDTVIGGAGDDRVSGFRGGDRLVGGAGSDQLWGGPGHDRLFGGDDQDLLNGWAGDDRLDGGGARDQCIGGLGTDTFVRCEARSRRR